MFSNYFKMAWRSLLKHKVFSVINISGLSIGLGIAVLILFMVLNEFSYDNFHKNLPNIHLLMKNQQQADGISTGSSTAGPMAHALKNEMPGVRWAARIAYAWPLVSVGDKTMYESGMYADADLFRMMSFAVVKGDPISSLEKDKSMVITEEVAKKWFGSADPIGQTIVFDHSHNIKIGAVVKDIPSNSTIRFGLVIPFSIFESANPWLTKWDDNRIETWLQTEPGADLHGLNERLTKLLQQRSDDKSVSLFVYPLQKMRLYRGFQNGQPSGGRIVVVRMIAVIGLFILLIACINFMNLATASAEYRAREVGVRKVLGASRNKIILQFLCEALLLTFLASLVGLGLGYFALPVLNRLTENDIPYNLMNLRIFLSLLAVVLLTALVAGSYPAFFLGRFNTTRVLKGGGAEGRSKGLLRKALVTVQFIISIFFIVGTIVVYVEIDHIRKRPLGYDQENLIDIHANGALAGNFELFKNELSGLPGVKAISAGSDNLLQFGSGITGMDWPGKVPGQEISILVSDVQYGWIKTAGLSLVEGRDFSPLFGTDSLSCLINQTTVEKLGLKEPVIGTKLGGKTIIGVFRNFVFNNPSGIIAPMAIYLNTTSLNHFFVRIQNDGHWRQTIADIEKISKKINPEFPFEFDFISESFKRRFEEFDAYGMMTTVFGGFAIFISCLGLFGLSAFVATKRGKEMSIRKVFGASSWRIGIMLSKDFLKPVLIAFLIVTPLAVWGLQLWLNNIPYRIQLSWWMFAVAGLIAVFIAMLTVSYQGIKTSLQNPVKSLRNE